MHYGVLSTVDGYPELGEARAVQRPNEVLELVSVAEELGFESFWVTEHHFRWGGALPAPAVWLAAAAQRTRRIRLGVLVAVLPLHEPCELAEQYALADRLSGGRLEIGVGCGYVAEEFRGFGRPLAERHVALRRSLPEFVRAMTGSALMDREIPKGELRLNVAPIQRPHPPIWVAAGRTETIRQVGREGDRLALVPYATLSEIGELAGHVGAYRRALPAGLAGRSLAAMHIYVGPETDRAMRALERFLATRPPVGESSRPAGSFPDARGHADRLRGTGLALVGTEAEVRPRLEEILRSGLTDLVGIFDFGALPGDLVVDSMRRWCRMVANLGGAPTEVGRTDPGFVREAAPVPELVS
jgi:alkanesulfonate monooxygenase SsuD/methylene tetrahydromethanopterin reductase-like flavin-dependent oxidoreductase (luciferase family)